MTTKRPIEPLTRDEFHRLLDATGLGTTTGARDRALLALLGGAALRLAEALALEPRDIDFRRGTINVRRGKGAKQRQVALGATMLGVVRQWLDVRPPGAGPLLCAFSAGREGRPLTQQQASRTLRRLADRASIEKRVHPHGLRHSCTAWLAEAGTPIHVVRDALGHTNLATTNRYLSVVAPEQVRGAFQGLDLG
jgi:site-specific recombinase XerD